MKSKAWLSCWKCMYQQESSCSNLGEELVTGGRAEPWGVQKCASWSPVLPISMPGSPLVPDGMQIVINP